MLRASNIDSQTTQELWWTTRYGEKIYREAKDGSINEVSYMSPRPGSPEPVAKRSHITKVSNLICSVGYYSDPF